jgi:hypothetical protein
MKRYVQDAKMILGGGHNFLGGFGAKILHF